ncbi:MAG: ATP-binding cassette domain-containing protein [Clostridiaceae bacterium]|nr:ATP-binding cassette domain-containing protein [Clostridiaceae bacterium]
MELLELKKVSYISKGKYILKDISLKIKKGDFISVVGASGSGKSTLFKICSHLLSQSEGEIVYKNKNADEYDPIKFRKEISYCFQTPYLFGDKVIDNILFPFIIRNKEIDMSRVKELFFLFNLSEDFLNMQVENLSGGEKQRIALIRALLFEPVILLLDEITSALDSENVFLVENVIQALNNKGMTIMWITHNKEQSKKYANKLLVLEVGEIKALEMLK